MSSGIGKISSMSFDSYGNNLYYCDEERMRAEVLSISTKYSLPVYRASHGEIPQSIVVVPEHGVFFLAVAVTDGVVIKRVNMDGTQILPHMTGTKLSGPKVVLSYDRKTEKVYWFDSGKEIIEYMNVSFKLLASLVQNLPPILRIFVIPKLS